MLEIKKKKGLVAAGRKAAGQQLTRAFRTHSREFSFSFGLPIPPLFCIEKRKKKTVLMTMKLSLTRRFKLLFKRILIRVSAVLL